MMEKALCFEELWIWQQARASLKDMYQKVSQDDGAKDMDSGTRCFVALDPQTLRPLDLWTFRPLDL